MRLVEIGCTAGELNQKSLATTITPPPPTPPHPLARTRVGLRVGHTSRFFLGSSRTATNGSPAVHPIHVGSRFLDWHNGFHQAKKRLGKKGSSVGKNLSRRLHRGVGDANTHLVGSLRECARVPTLWV